MRKSNFDGALIVFALRQNEAGVTVVKARREFYISWPFPV
jgi:hypothetical protein